MAGAEAVWALLLCDARVAQGSTVADLWRPLTWRQALQDRSLPPLGRQSACHFCPTCTGRDAGREPVHICSHVRGPPFLCPRARVHGCGGAAIGPQSAQCGTPTGICQPVGDKGGSGAAGQWADNKPDGDGCYKYPNGDIFQGSFKQGLKHGGGSYYFKVRHALSAAALCQLQSKSCFDCSSCLSAPEQGLAGTKAQGWLPVL